MSDVSIIDIEPQKVIGVRQKGAYGKIAELIPMLFTFIMSIVGVKMKGSPTFLCHEKTIEEVEEAEKNQSADLEVCVPIEGEVDTESTKDYDSYELPGGKFATITHQGPYKETTKAYEKLFAWIKENGHQVKGPTREVYLNDPREVSEDELLTEIQAPIG